MALCLHVARRLSRLDLDVFFLGTAIIMGTANVDNLFILRHRNKRSESLGKNRYHLGYVGDAGETKRAGTFFG